MKRFLGWAWTVLTTVTVLCGALTFSMPAMAETNVYYSIADLKAQTADGWHQTYEAHGRTITVDVPVQVPDVEELSGIGAAYMAGIALGVFQQESLFSQMNRKQYMPVMSREQRNAKYAGWKAAVGKVLTSNRN